MKSLSEAWRGRGNEVALVDMRTGSVTTYAQMASLLLRGSAFLRHHGVRPGDRIVQRLPNSPEALCLFFICLENGIDCAPLSVRASGEEADQWLALTGAKLAVVSRTQSDAATDSLGKCSRFVRIDTSGDFGWLPNVAEAVAPDGPGRLLMKIAGRRGETRALVMPSQTMRRCAEAYGSLYPGLGSGTRFLNVAPLWTLYGLFNLGLLPMELGASVVIGGEFSTQTPSKFWHDADRFKADSIWLVPTMLRVLLDAHARALPGARDAMAVGAHRVRHGFIGMAPCTEAEKVEFARTFDFPLYESYGLSETLFVTARSPLHPGDTGTGRPLSGVEIRLKPTTVVPTIAPSADSGSAMEILVRSPYLYSGSLGPSGELEPPELDADGFFHTGDLGRMSPSGSLTVDGRVKAVVKRAGHLVFLPEIESLAQGIDNIMHARAVPTAHPYFGESYILVVRPKASGSGDSKVIESVRLALANRLSREKWPDQIKVDHDLGPRSNAT